MYLVDFFKRVTRKSNVPVIIYCVINVFIISMFFISAGGKGIMLGLLLYAGSLALALSPFGEWILRLQTKCKKIKNEEQLNAIMPIFNEVYTKAREKDPSISNDVKLFICQDKSVNAFATGRKTICVTEGIFQLPSEEIKAVLSHEFGHISHKDTDMILMVTVGNLFITVALTCFRIIVNLMCIFADIFSNSFLGSIGSIIVSFLTTLFIDLFMLIWTKFGTALVMKSMRANEYEADEFACQMGYGRELCLVLDKTGTRGAKGLFAALSSTHPASEDRVSKIEEMLREERV